MFSAETYTARRQALAKKVGSGLILFLGNSDSPMNYAANVYHFRQDSNFLYFFGIDRAGLAATLDSATGEATIYGNELTMDDIVWTGDLPTISEQAAMAGVNKTAPMSSLAEAIKGKKVQYAPPYRGKNIIWLSELLSTSPAAVKAGFSKEVISGIVDLRSYKSAEEIEQLDIAVRVTDAMHIRAMEVTRPGLTEADVHAAVQEAVHSYDSHASFPPIISVRGEVLHNHAHSNIMNSGQLLLVDCGGESPMHYAGDMTRTFPVDPTFNTQQREVYEVALASQVAAVNMLRPGVPYRDVHLESARVIASGLKDLGIMKGDTAAAVAAGAHALFFPHGLGHMMGLDVHDMEDLGEDHVGYNAEYTRSDQFGLAFLRLGKELETGFVITVEPGIYFIPQLIDQWKAEGLHSEFINFDALDAYRTFGGIRIEEDLLITEDGSRLLGDGVPKTVADIEELRG